MTNTLVNWREWGEEAFAEAVLKDRLVLLDISAVWCHWCHVMDETSYNDTDLAALINERFIPVRVDTDRMPDVNERYNMGGWPTTAVLTPTGEVLLGATYVPPDKLRETLTGLDGFFHENREALREKIAELKAKREAEREAETTAPAGEITPNITAYVLEELDRTYDPVHGGFGTEPKFPFPDAVGLLLLGYRDTGRQDYLDMAEKTLAGMSSYGMYDQVMGGFFRYSVTQDWAVPHFEKMLDGNAALITAYVDACRLTGDARHLETVKRTLGYVDKWLWSDEGYFFGSQDADEEYYRLTMEDRLKRTPPAVDRTMFTNLNAHMASAYLSAWELSGEAICREKALKALEFILTRMKGEDGGLYHYYDGRPHRYGLLTDDSAAIKALLHAYQITGDKRRLNEAVSILSYLDKTHWDKEGGGYFDLPADAGALGALSNRAKPLAENTEMAYSLKTISVITGEEKYADMAVKCLAPHTRVYRDYSYMAAGYALAVDFCLKPATEVAIVGKTDSPDMDALTRAAFSCYVPRRVLRILDFKRDLDEIKKKGFHTSGPASAYVCRGETCLARMEDPEKLKEALTK